MTLSKSQIYLYAADYGDYNYATEVATHFGLPSGNVVGSYALAYTATASGKFMVVAVGQAANNALFYNQCGFSGFIAGSTPFNYLNTVRDILPGANNYMNASGSTGTDSYDLAFNYVYYALNGNCNGCYSGISPIDPTDSCIGANPVNGNTENFGNSCSASVGCSGSSSTCSDTIADVQSAAVSSGWDPENTAQNIINLMTGMGVNTSGFDKYMAVAAMINQGCYNCQQMPV